MSGSEQKAPPQGLYAKPEDRLVMEDEFFLGFSIFDLLRGAIVAIILLFAPFVPFRMLVVIVGGVSTAILSKSIRVKQERGFIEMLLYKYGLIGGSDFFCPPGEGITRNYFV